LLKTILFLVTDIKQQMTQCTSY